MAKPIKDLIKDWPKERLARVDKRAKALISEEMTLRDVRKARALTQVQLAKALGIGQEHVSRLEHQSDMLLSTLASYVRGMGGDLRLTVEFPDRPPVALTSFADALNQAEAPPEKNGRRKGERHRAA